MFTDIKKEKINIKQAVKHNKLRKTAQNIVGATLKLCKYFTFRKLSICAFISV